MRRSGPMRLRSSNRLVCGVERRSSPSLPESPPTRWSPTEQMLQRKETSSIGASTSLKRSLLGGASEEIRSYLKAIARGAWRLVGWLTHEQNASRFDAMLTISAYSACPYPLHLGLSAGETRSAGPLSRLFLL